MNQERMKRVKKDRPCTVCRKPDWCLYAKDGSAAICARVGEGAIRRCGDAGWLHILINRPNVPNRHRTRVRKRKSMSVGSFSQKKPKDFRPLSEQYQRGMSEILLDKVAGHLGVTPESLNRLRIGWDGQAYTFPMCNSEGDIIGIRRRFLRGSKVSVKGSKTGLFIPQGWSQNSVPLVCEGVTDTAAALDLGFEAVGRPNCNSRELMLTQFLKNKDIVIVTDNDEAGIKGARSLARRAVVYCPSVRIITPPEGIKDLRQWRCDGVTRDELLRIIANSTPLEVSTKVNLIIREV